MILHRCKCGEVFEPPEDRKDYQFAPCPECGQLANRIVKKAPLFFIKGQFEAYESPITGEIISSARQRAEEMKRHDCVDYEPTIRNDIDRSIKEAERKLEKAVDETVDYQLSTMDSRKRELLEQELSSGADIEYTRIGDE